MHIRDRISSVVLELINIAVCGRVNFSHQYHSPLPTPYLRQTGSEKAIITRVMFPKKYHGFGENKACTTDSPSWETYFLTFSILRLFQGVGFLVGVFCI